MLKSSQMSAIDLARFRQALINANRSVIGEFSRHGTGTSGGGPNVMLPPPELTHHPGLFSPIIPVRTAIPLSIRDGREPYPSVQHQQIRQSLAVRLWSMVDGRWLYC